MNNNPNHQNLPDSFRELSLPDLKRYAGRWDKKFNDAQTQLITLYRYSSKYQGSLGKEVSTKYFVVFEVSINYDEFETYKEQLSKGAEPDPAYEAYGELLSATQYYQTVSHDLLYLVDSSFQTTAYKDTGRENFKYEWQFFPKGPDDNLPLGVLADEPCWVLYPDSVEDIKSENQVELPKERILKCTPTTKWEDIRITLISDDTVKINTPSGEKRFGYEDLGLKDLRDGTPKKLWTYLKVFAKAQGVVSAEIFDDPELKKHLTVYAPKVNRHLQRLFDINESIYKGHYRKKMKYETRIMFSDATQIVGTKLKPKEQSQAEEIGKMLHEFEEHEKF